MHDRARDRDTWLEPETVRQRVLEQIGRLPVEEHLEVLDAVERRDVEIVLTAPRTVTIIVAERWEFDVPAQSEASDG